MAHNKHSINELLLLLSLVLLLSPKQPPKYQVEASAICNKTLLADNRDYGFLEVNWASPLSPKSLELCLGL